MTTGLVIALAALGGLAAIVPFLISRGRVRWWALIAYGGGLLAGAVTIFIGTWRSGMSSQTMIALAVVGGIAAIVAFLINRGRVWWWASIAYGGGILAGAVTIFILTIALGPFYPGEAGTELVWGMLIFGSLLTVLAPAIGALAAALSKGSCTPS